MALPQPPLGKEYPPVSRASSGRAARGDLGRPPSPWSNLRPGQRPPDPPTTGEAAVLSGGQNPQATNRPRPPSALDHRSTRQQTTHPDRNERRSMPRRDQLIATELLAHPQIRIPTSHFLATATTPDAPPQGAQTHSPHDHDLHHQSPLTTTHPHPVLLPTYSNQSANSRPLQHEPMLHPAP